ncbi:MAG TPA: putative ABC exporter domain-containing protein [Vicinamibacterales bacterium]|jgi:hypothetical protein|nr:putative ABC exporter domain-containing protein [Vicinamibacterales bacterium]
MLAASFYITACSMRNRVQRWARRLREPRYLIGFVGLVAYFYLSLFAPTARARPRPPSAVFPGFASILPVIATALLALAASSWLFPVKSRLMEFSPAEIQFLATAPVRRRDLLIHRVIRLQSGLFFASILQAFIFAAPRRSLALGLQSAFAVWLLLLEMLLFFSAIEPARAHLGSKDRRARGVARVPLLATLAAVAAIIRVLVHEFSRQPLPGATVFSRLDAALGSSAAAVVLWPFEAVLRPLTVVGWSAYGATIAGSLLVVVATAAWLVVSDGYLHDAAVDVDEQLIDKPQQRKVMYAARAGGWTLAPTGRPEVALIWKSAMQIFRVVDRRILLRVVLIVAMLSAVVLLGFRSAAPGTAVGLIALAGAAYATFLGPQMLRLDFRQDLEHLEVVKTWPIRPAALVRGEIAGPATALSAIACSLIALASVFSGVVFPHVPADVRLDVAVAALLVSPTVIFGQYALHNSIAVMFPAWVPLGAGRPRGVEAMGQRMLMVYGTWFLLVLMLLPGGVVGGLLWLVLYRAIGALVFPMAAVAGAVVMAFEVLALTELLGPAFERIDLLAIERPA